jgi:hypothetical protein
VVLFYANLHVRIQCVNKNKRVLVVSRPFIPTPP